MTLPNIDGTRFKPARQTKLNANGSYVENPR